MHRTFIRAVALSICTTALGSLPGLADELPAEYHTERLAGPDRSEIFDQSGVWEATFTDGSYTVTLNGPSRTFTDSNTSAAVVLTTWVRLLAAPFAGEVDPAWLGREIADPSPDLLQVAMQYVGDAPPIADASGLQIAGAAQYGPLLPDGTRQEGSDFNDYLGIPWSDGPVVHQPQAAQFRSLDCSGLIRMVFGYRGGLPLGLNSDGTTLPRRAVQMLAAAPGVVTVPNRGVQVTEFSPLAAGDLLFFDADPADGPLVDHVGITLGLDTEGHQRFLSSRKMANGPTLGDKGGRSILDGSGLYARAFRAARRL